MTAPLGGKRGLVVGIANADSIAHGCARAFREAGAELAVTYLNAKAEPHVRPLAEALSAPLILPCDLRQAGQLEAVFAAVAAHWGRLDFLLHSVAFAPREDLHGRVVDCSTAGFATAMDVSCHSFLRMARLAEPLMAAGGTLLTVTFYGSARVVPNYNLMGPVPGADEAGYAGLEDGVDYHWGRLFLAAGLATLLNLGLELGRDDESDIARAIRESGQDTVGRAGEEIVRRQLSVPPTLTVRPGFPVRVIVHRDLVLEPYGG